MNAIWIRKKDDNLNVIIALPNSLLKEVTQYQMDPTGFLSLPEKLEDPSYRGIFICVHEELI